MDIYKKSIYDIGTALEKADRSVFNSALIIPDYLCKEKSLTPEDLIFNPKDGMSLSGGKQIRINAKKNTITVLNYFTLNIEKIEKIYDGEVTAYYMKSETSPTEMISKKCESHILELIHKARMREMYEIPSDLDDLDVAVILVWTRHKSNGKNTLCGGSMA